MSMKEVASEVAPKNKTLYVRGEDHEVWEKAEKLAGSQSISALVTSLLRRYVEQREAVRGRIVVAVAADDESVVRKAFQGRMLVVGFYSDAPEVMAGTTYHAAQGANGGLALWTGRAPDPRDADGFWPYNTFEDAVADKRGWPQDFLSAVSSALDEEYAEEIDL